MKKNLAIFLDGTWNAPGDNTNVWRLKVMVAGATAAGVPQLGYYDTGVGTKWNERLRGGTLGAGLSLNIREAYQWLVEQYDDDDDVYVFGFSRGAYTARSLAGLIVKCGLLRPGAALTVQQIYERYQLGKGATPLHEIDFIKKNNKRELTAAERALHMNSRRIPIKMIGVWDTVGALGIPWTNAPLVGRGNFYFHNTNPSVLFEHAYHALAIDEHRAPYKATLWTRFKPASPAPAQPPIAPAPPAAAAVQRNNIVEQRWFVGAHSNVGGGYTDDELGQIPLAWLQEKARACGLAFRNQTQLTGDEFKGTPTDSYAAFLKGFYKIVRFGKRYYRPIGADARAVKGGTSQPINEWIDASVFQRCRAFPNYRPPNLLEWAKRKGRSLETLNGDQQA